jgi:hypothetical protein
VYETALIMRLLRFVLVGLMAGCGPGTGRVDLEPPDSPTGQAYEAVTGGAISVSWRNPRAADFAETLLARIVTGTDAPHGNRPSDKSSPKAGDPFGGSPTFGPGVVLYVGKAATFLDVETPDKCTAFVYQLYSKDTAGNWSVGPAQIDVDPGATSTAPLAAPTALTAAAVDGDVQLAWTNPPASSGVVELRVVRKEGSAPRTPTDGVAIFSGKGSATVEPLAGMGFGAWTYGVFACNGCGVCNPTPATVVFTRSGPPVDGGMDGGGGGGGSDGGTPGPLTPTNFTQQLSGDGKNVLMSWTNPAEVTSVKVVRTLNAAAIGPGDSSATVVFQGSGTSTTERVEKLMPSTSGSPQVWHYRVYGCKNGSCEATGIATTLSLTLAQALRGGGYTLFWRHATANVCGDQTQLGPASNTTQPDWWRSCDKNCLTAYARQIDSVNAPNETFTIHTAFATRGFTVGKVISSEFCRAVETAQGFDFGPTIELSQALTYYVYDEGQRCTNTMALLNTPPPPGTNTAMVSHAGFTCAIVDSLAWGEAAIYRPMGAAAPRFMGRVAWNGWTMLP